SQPRRRNSLFGKLAKERRPAGLSRRRKKQLRFEALEARQVMSATPLVQAPNGQEYSAQTYSSATEDGALQIWLNELYWQSLIEQSAGVSQYTTLAIPTDPLLGRQWHLINSGQEVGQPDWQPIYGVPGEDINVAPVWE